MKPTVLVLQEQVPPYRVPLFRSVAQVLSSHGLELRVASSSVLDGADALGFRHVRVRMSQGGLAALDTVLRERPTALVLPHSGRFAPIAFAARLLPGCGRRQLFWGMGLARRYSGGSPADRRPAGEAVRYLMLSVCDHYLSYTGLSTQNLVVSGFDGSRITTLNNAVEPLASPEEATAAQRVPLQALFVASLVEDKEPLAAVEIVNKLRYLAPSATLHIVGDGPLRLQCERAANRYDWIHYHGLQRGPSLRELALASDIAIIPGRVGLAVLEMATAGLPMVTFSGSPHGAEIVYLEDGINGLLLNGDVETSAKEIWALLTDREALERMRNKALSITRTYTVQNMAAKFAEGVMASLS